MTMHANGPFDVKLRPLEQYNRNDGASLGRMSIDKEFHGDLEATSKGEMLTAMGTVQGSAGYVAIERVTGTLNGRSGSFALQHSSTMARGKPSQNIVVVPDSGTGDLAGLGGSMTIVIADHDGQRKHFYKFEYFLTATAT
ncbi:MAG TPA: DUF3224 domain-containing protein [Rudaea sp.]